MEDSRQDMSGMQHCSLPGGGAGKKRADRLLWFPRTHSEGNVEKTSKGGRAVAMQSLMGAVGADTVLGDLWDLKCQGPLDRADSLPPLPLANKRQPFPWQQCSTIPGRPALAALDPSPQYGAMKGAAVAAPPEAPQIFPDTTAVGSHSKPLGARRLVHQLLEVLCLVVCLVLGLLLLYTILFSEEAATKGPPRRIMLARESVNPAEEAYLPQADKPAAAFKHNDGMQRNLGTAKRVQEIAEAMTSSLPALVVGKVQESIKDTIQKQGSLGMSKTVQEITEAFSSSLPAMVVAKVQKSINDATKEQSKLHRVVRRIAGKHRSIVVTQVNVKGKVKVAKWYDAVQKTGHSKNVLFIADDNASYKHLKENWPKQTVHFKDFVQASPAGSFEEPTEADEESQPHDDLVYRKRLPKYLKALIQMNVTVLFSELQYPWHEDPLNEAHNGLDLEGTEGSSKALRRTLSSVAVKIQAQQKVQRRMLMAQDPPISGKEDSTVVVFQPTPQSHNILSLWDAELEAGRARGDTLPGLKALLSEALQGAKLSKGYVALQELAVFS